jgi:SAM-dependent methyltransferase
MSSKMTKDFSYQDYVTDKEFLDGYNAYQARYAANIRESDKVIIGMIKKMVAQAGPRRLKILDIGCSTGNLLLHLNRMLPNADYVGGDLALSSLEQCRENPDLAGIFFEQLDITKLPPASYDIVIVNAVLYMFDEAQYDQALQSIAQSLRPDGACVIYDFAHPFEHQNLTINETSLMHPNGLRLCFRPMKYIASHMAANGLGKVDFTPFELPIELPKPGYDHEVVTYTVNGAAGNRMMFRGTLFQPWCHMVARK